MFDWLKLKLIKWGGGYTDIDDLLESTPNYQEKRRILNLAVKRLYNTIGPDDILKVHESGAWMLEGKPIPEEKKKLLIAEATQFLMTELWKVLQADVEWQANRKMYLLAETEMDIAAGKLWKLTLDVFRTRLNSLKQGSAFFNSKGQ